MSEATAIATNLILSGTNVHLEEQDVQLKKPEKTVRVRAQLNDIIMSDFYHSIIRVQAPKGTEAWVIDVSGAQYSIFDACLGEKTYHKRFVTQTSATYKFGKNRAVYEAIKKLKGDGALMARIGLFAAAKVDKAVANWKSHTKQEFSEFFLKAEGTFNEEKKRLLKEVARSFDDYDIEVANKFSLDIKNTQKYMLRMGGGWFACSDVTEVTDRIMTEHLVQ